VIVSDEIETVTPELIEVVGRMHSAPDPVAPTVPWITDVPAEVVRRKKVAVPVAVAAVAVMALAVNVPVAVFGAKVDEQARFTSSVFPLSAALALAGGVPE
jgi:hypothetical protein